MGKIRVKTLGEDEQEKEQKKRDEGRRAAKRAKKEKEQVKTQPPGRTPPKAMTTARGKGGERIKTVEPAEEDVVAVSDAAEKKSEVKKATTKVATTKQKEAGKLPPNRRPHIRSKRYTKVYESIDRTKRYEISEAIKLVKDTSNVKFNGTIEAHFNLTKKPKELNLKSSKNPKDPKSPNISYEKKFPLAHAKVGSVKDTDGDVKKQLDALIKKIGVKNIVKLTLSSTMGPGVKVLLE